MNEKENPFQLALKISSAIDGWLTPRESRVLFELARNCRKGESIVEIGDWMGKSTVILGSGSLAGEGNQVYSIDPHTGSIEQRKRFGEIWTFEQFTKNIERAGLSEIVKPLVMTSGDASEKVDGNIGLLFIDGDHDYRMVENDFMSWFPKLSQGGMIAFHDTMGKPGPKKVVNKYIFKSSKVKNVGYVDTITFAMKVDQNSFMDRFRNRRIRVAKEISEIVFNMKRKKATICDST